MQILTNADGTRLKLNKTEERKLLEARNILFTIEKHSDEALENDAGLAARTIDDVFELLIENKPNMPVTSK